MTKICTKCKLEQPAGNFHKKKTSKDGLTSNCKSCRHMTCQNYRDNNKRALREYDKKYRKENRERETLRLKNWRETNPEKYHANRKAYEEAYKTERRAITAKRRAKKLKATPSWANLVAIREFYMNCPPGYEVDHIIPLQGKTVCGLHVLENLQYLPMIENRKKGNKFGEINENCR